MYCVLSFYLLIRNAFCCRHDHGSNSNPLVSPEDVAHHDHGPQNDEANDAADGSSIANADCQPVQDFTVEEM